ncbi:hypothetical protein ACKUB1_10060 [Methanospirillum stamsii]|uniref:Uncharacterized protein n=1 Tax=Methanospirillum stamsii TaxID=1277351 RepID=A0A2V2MQ98_9EURY|nr:hypothetical protein [Methanospirillum stamsii]PWR70282.1 hypothetical protein DLD82_15845 [Methanospirillum stamsii]
MTARNYVPDIWYMIAGRIAPPFCCSIPPIPYRVFQMAMGEVSKKEGDIDRAVSLLHDIIANVPPEWMVFEQASQLLNVIGWRNTYHREWFSSDQKVSSFRPGTCGPHVAHAYALMQAAVDEDALSLADRIIRESIPYSDDYRMARLIRISILICLGRIDEGEQELSLMDSPGT